MSVDQSEPAEPFRLRSLTLSVYSPAFLFSVGQGAVAPIIPLIATNDLHASIAVAGLVVALRGIGTIVFDIPAGVMVSRLGERKAVMFSTLALVLFSLGAAHSPSIWVYALMIFAFGNASAVWHLARLTFMSARAPLEIRGRALSLLGGTSRVGTFVGPIMGGSAGVAFGLGTAFYIQAVLALIGAVVMLIFVRDEDDQVEGRHHRSVSQEIAAVLSEHRQVFMTAGVVAMCIGLMRNARQAVLPLWGNSIGMDAAAIGALFSISSAIDMAVFYPMGIVMDRWGRKWAAIPCLVLMGVGMTLIPLSTSFVTLMLVGLILGMGNGFGAGIVMTLGADFAPPAQRGEFLGVWRLIADLGQAAGPLVVGGLSALVTLGVASAATGGLGLAAAVMMWLLVPEPLRRERETLAAAHAPAVQEPR